MMCPLFLIYVYIHVHVLNMNLPTYCMYYRVQSLNVKVLSTSAGGRAGTCPA